MIHKIKVFGVGGVGLPLMNPLCRFLAYNDYNAQITLIDGDDYKRGTDGKPGNEVRQSFVEEGNKAEVTKKTLEKEFQTGLYFTSEKCYLDETNAVRLIRENDLVLGCVDNHPTRLMISNRCCELANVTCIAGGNNYTDGAIQCHVRRNGKNLTLPLANEFHPEIQKPKVNNHPKELARLAGCEEAASAGEPQLVITNFFVAAIMLNAAYAYFRGKLDYDEVFLDVVLNGIRVERRTTK